MMELFKQYQTETNEDGSVNVKDVEIFRLGKHKGFAYDKEWMDKAVANHTSQKADGFLPSVIIGHNQYDGNEKPSRGFLDNLRLSDDEQTVVADLTKIPEDVFGDMKKRAWPHRSVEVDASGARFTALALLGGTQPYHKLPVMEFGSDENSTVINFEMNANKLAASDTDKNLSGMRGVLWRFWDYIDGILDKSVQTDPEDEKEIRNLLVKGSDLPGKIIDEFHEAKGETNMSDEKQFTEEDLTQARSTAFAEEFQSKFGMTYDEYEQKQAAEASEAHDARVKAFADVLKGRKIAPAIIDEIIVPILNHENGQVQFAEDSQHDIQAALEHLFNKLFEADATGSLIVDFGEKAEGNSGDSLENQFGVDDDSKLHEEALRLAEERSGQSSGVKFSEEYQKAVFEIIQRGEK